MSWLQIEIVEKVGEATHVEISCQRCGITLVKLGQRSGFTQDHLFHICLKKVESKEPTNPLWSVSK